MPQSLLMFHTKWSVSAFLLRRHRGTFPHAASCKTETAIKQRVVSSRGGSFKATVLSPCCSHTDQSKTVRQSSSDWAHQTTLNPQVKPNNSFVKKSILQALRSFHFCSLSSNFCVFFFCLFVPIPGLILRAPSSSRHWM